MIGDIPGGTCDYCGAEEGRCWDDCPTVKMDQQADEITRLRAIEADWQAMKDERDNLKANHEILVQEIRHLEQINVSLREELEYRSSLQKESE